MSVVYCLSARDPFELKRRTRTLEEGEIYCLVANIRHTVVRDYLHVMCSAVALWQNFRS